MPRLVRFGPWWGHQESRTRIDDFAISTATPNADSTLARQQPGRSTGTYSKKAANSERSMVEMVGFEVENSASWTHL